MAYDDTPDEELVSRIRDGDHDLYRHIVLRYEKKLKRYALRLTNRKNDVDDIVQNVFLKAYRNLPSFDRNLKFSSWLYRIAHNESINHIKSSFIQRFVSIEQFFNLYSFSHVEEEVEQKVQKEQVFTCIDQLDLKYREPLVLFYSEEKSYAEISDILRIPKKTVGVLIYRAREKVREICSHSK